MSLLYKVLFAWKCSSTHHKLAMDALRHLRGDQAPAWRDFFLSQIDAYLRGSKAPDDEFKDFRNHVLHVSDSYWGGATGAATDWYKKTVVALAASDWPRAAYNAGVLSHYVTDPFQPMHTGQSEAEGSVHRALEWSIAQSYDALQSLLEQQLGGYPAVEVPTGNEWLTQVIRRGAELAHPHYDPLIDHYDLARGVKDPPAGLDPDSRRRIALLIGQAAVALSRVLERAFAEAGVTPPPVNLTMQTVLSTVSIPVRWITKKMADAGERKIVEAMYAEFEQTGKVIQSLPEDDRAVRKMHAEEVLHVPLASLDAQQPRRPGSQYGRSTASPGEAAVRRDSASAPPLPTKGKSALHGATALPPAAPRPEKKPERPATLPLAAVAPERTLRFYLGVQDPVVDAPSIGPKTANRMAEVAIHTVRDLLACNPETTARQLDLRGVDAETIRDWQDQATLVCRVPHLRGGDAQILVACGVRSAEQLAASKAIELCRLVDSFTSTSAGQRILRSAAKPDRDEVQNWITWASQARGLRAA